MRAKLGFETEQENNLTYLKHLLGVLGSSGMDYTAFFRRLSHYTGERTELLALCELQTPPSE